MDIREYLESGVLEQYCLGILPADGMQEVERLCKLYPEIQLELDILLRNITNYVSAAPPAALPSGLKGQLWDILENLNKEKNISLDELPLINRFTDFRNWLPVVGPFIPGHPEEDRIVRVLRESDKVIQMLVISRTDFEDEIHVHEQESFIILQGECECTIGGDVFRLTAGGFTDIPLHTPHAVRILSPYVVAVLQRIAL